MRTTSFSRVIRQSCRSVLGLCFVAGLSATSGNADEPLDYLIQKVCVDAHGHVLMADPYDPPAGSTLRNLRVGEALPYYKHDQPVAGSPDGRQRHDSYPELDTEGQVIVINPFYFDPAYSGNGFDIYMLRDGWTSVGETQDGGGFSTTFYGRTKGRITPYNAWVFFPSSFLKNDSSIGRATAAITGNYWEHMGVPWHGGAPGHLDAGSETSWQLIRNCSFGGVNGAPVKRIDAIQSVHGYISKGNPNYESNRAKGHLEVFYFTKIYGVTRWEDWTPIEQLGDANRPSEMRTHALLTSRECARAIPEAGQRYIQPTDLPALPENRLLVTDYAGEDGVSHTYMLLNVRDWSAVKILDVPQLPPPCPNPCQNVVQNFHFDADSLVPWVCSQPNQATLAQSKTAVDTQFSAGTVASGGVRYLAWDSRTPHPASQIYQDIPVKNLHDGIYTLSAKLRSVSGHGIMRMTLQQLDSGHRVLATSIDTRSVAPASNSGHQYEGPHDNAPMASVYLASTLISGDAPVTLEPDVSFLRVTLEPQSADVFDIVNVELSESHLE